MFLLISIRRFLKSVLLIIVYTQENAFSGIVYEHFKTIAVVDIVSRLTVLFRSHVC